MYLSGMWFGEAPGENDQKDICLKDSGMHVPNMITILSSIVNII